MRSNPEGFPIGFSLLVALGVIIAGIIGALLGTLCALVLGTTPRSLADEHLTLGLIVDQLVTYVPILVFLVIALPRVAHRSLRGLGLGAPRFMDLAFGIGGAVLMCIAVTLTALLQKRLTGISGEQKVVSMFQDTHPGLLLNLFVVIAVVIAPIVEEFVFRGFVFNALLRRMPLALAAILSGILFGAVHGEPIVIAPLAIGGAVLAWIYYSSGSLWSSMLAHATFNAINLAGVLVYHVKS